VSATPTLLLAAPNSGAGKTMSVSALARAFVSRGLRVRTAKSGPDYIDPRFHAAASGSPSLNLDTWAMPSALVAALLEDARRDADLVLLESAMGLFDGAPLDDGAAGSAADLAARHRIPVVVLLDVSSQFQTAAAVVRGLATHDPAVRVVGVILNRVASPRHADPIARAISKLGIPVLGAIPTRSDLGLPSRHLGLVQAEEHEKLDAWLDQVAELVEAHVDLDALLELARVCAEPPPAGIASDFASVPAPGARVALASDAAFSFIYPHLMRSWERAGVQVVPFSPLADQPPPPECDACWLPGGYPELHAARLARASRFQSGLRSFATQHPVHGECGGYMVLGRQLIDAEGNAHPMLGLLGHSTSFAERRLHIGYREAHWRAPAPRGFGASTMRGHEFHYAVVTDPGSDTPCADLFDARGTALGPAGGRRGNVTGTFFHSIAACE